MAAVRQLTTKSARMGKLPLSRIVSALPKIRCVRFVRQLTHSRVRRWVCPRVLRNWYMQIMDSTRLITIVQEYEELYNLQHRHYSNQQRRDNVWEEIGARLNQPGNACKLRWTRIRDNYRKALNLRKTKSDQALSKLKPPKYYQELNFLTPYMNDDEERLLNLSPIGVDCNLDQAQHETQSDPSHVDKNTLNEPSDTQDSLSTSSVTSSRIGVTKSRIAASKGPITANVLQKYLSRNAAALNENQSDPLIEFFINMAKTVKTFPIQDQVQIKAQLFQMVNSVEMRLALTSSSSPSPSNSLFPRPSI